MRLFEHPDFDQVILQAAEHFSSVRRSSRRIDSSTLSSPECCKYASGTIERMTVGYDACKAFQFQSVPWPPGPSMTATSLRRQTTTSSPNIVRARGHSTDSAALIILLLWKKNKASLHQAVPIVPSG